MTTPGSTVAAGLVARLVAGGWSKRQIGRSIGVNDSYVGRILTGARGTTGAGYVGRLQQLAGTAFPGRGVTVPTTAPVERRKQRIRRPTRILDTPRASTARVRRQAAQKGAPALAGEIEHAAQLGRRIAIDLQVKSQVWRLMETSGSRRPDWALSRVTHTVTIGNVDPRAFAQLVRDYDGNVVAAALQWLADSGRSEIGGDEWEDVSSEIVGVEVRTWE